ncbi:MAG: hypothetical protein ACYCTB_01670 [bacterium]
MSELADGHSNNEITIWQLTFILIHISNGLFSILASLSVEK